MLFQVLQEDLIKSVNSSIRFIAARPTLPILSNFQLIAKGSTLHIQATNLEMSIADKIGASVEEEGVITIPAKIFHEIVSNLPKGKLKFEVIKEELKIEASDWKGKIPTSPSNDFPKIPDSIDEKKSFTLNKEDLAKNLSKILFSASLDETRPVLAGVLFIFTKSQAKDPSTLTFVASDGYRLSKKTIKLDKDIQSKNLIIPRPAIAEIIKQSTESSAITFEVKEDDNQIVVKIGDAYLSSRLIDGNFPEFEKIIPVRWDTKVNVDKNDLGRGVKLASVFARDSGNIIKMAIAQNNIELKSEGTKVGNQTGKIEAKVDGSPLEISFNYKFIEEFLNVVEGDSVEIKLTDQVSPAIFADPLNPDFLHLIMPVVTQN